MTRHHQSRPPKKTQSLEVRVSEEEKRAFLDACQAAGRSASEVLRRLMRLFVIVQQQRKRYTNMLKLNVLKTLGAGIATAVLALVISSGLLLAPAANAKAQLNYRIVVEDGIGEIVSVGQMDMGAEMHANPVTDSLGEAVQYELRASSCSSELHPDCSQGHYYVEVNVLTRTTKTENIQNALSLIIKEGEFARVESLLKNGYTLTADLEADKAKQGE